MNTNVSSVLPTIRLIRILISMLLLIKTAKYSLFDNPTGIFVPAGENLVVMVADLNGLDKVNIRVQNLDKPGQDRFGGTEYTIVNGVNTISIKEKGTCVCDVSQR